jgi:hypothetical protein
MEMMGPVQMLVAVPAMVVMRHGNVPLGMLRLRTVAAR